MKFLPFLTIFSILSAQWSSQSAYLLEKDRKEVSIFRPFKYGMKNGSEFSVNKFLLMPSLSVKQEMSPYGSWKMARLFRLEYPTPGLKWLQSPLGKEMGDPNMGALISPQFFIPHMLSFYVSAFGTKGSLKSGQLSLSSGLGLALNAKKLSDDATIDLPIIYSRLSVYFNGLIINFGGEYYRKLSKSINYLIDYKMYLMPGGRGRYSFEQQGLLMWQASSTFTFSFGYKLIAGEYPFGSQAHLLPTFDIQFGW
ncbi:MAG: hypothetical protein Ct9H90mP7_2470 [Candidatus Neomarinimicrobiota bacterium]|nr:MAG: hypothetical protein Ct9H90mP7_2470 [Candidatus Neomarinimicrobiota bacterium]